MGMGAGMFYTNPKHGDATIDWVFSLVSGGEYFIDEHFSLGIEGQIDVTRSDEQSLNFGNPDRTNVNTGTAFYATLYF
ncbi:MAG: hypothetical protein GF313_03865 [Caldithrix sp.]|nr:hypothetical protein [Caldithrix sp.]